MVTAGDSYAWAPDTPEADARAAWMLPPPAEVFVLEDGEGRVVGTATLKPNQPALGAHVANASFMVDPTYRGRGAGRSLAEAVIEHARLAGYRGMQFNAVVATNEPAVKLWKSLGFEVVGTIPSGFCHTAYGYVDLLVMFRALDAL